MNSTKQNKSKTWYFPATNEKIGLPVCQSILFISKMF